LFKKIFRWLTFPFRWDESVYPIFSWWKPLLRPLCLLNGHRPFHVWAGPPAQSCDRCGKEMLLLLR
jgi:hypothetical protein